MKKKLYFDPPKPTKLEEYITIESGKIRDVHIVQLGKEVPNELIDKGVSKFDSYLPLKNFHIPLTIKRIDPYIRKQKRIKYNYEIVLPKDEEFNNLDFKKVPPPEFILKGLIKNRKAFIHINFFESLYLDYQSFSWSKASTTIKISIIGIVSAIVIAIINWII